MVPAVNGPVVRIFQYRNDWFIADNESMENLWDAAGDPEIPPILGPMGQMFEHCLLEHYVRGIFWFLVELESMEQRVWFFALYPAEATLLFLGSCNTIPHTGALSMSDDFLGDAPIDVDFQLHSSVPPSVPIIPVGVEAMDLLLGIPLHKEDSLTYTERYDGWLLLNRQTLFAVRLCSPVIVYLSPLLRHQQSLTKFLAIREAEVQLYEGPHSGRLTVDAPSREWWNCHLRSTGDRIFAKHHGALMKRIR